MIRLYINTEFFLKHIDFKCHIEIQKQIFHKYFTNKIILLAISSNGEYWVSGSCFWVALHPSCASFIDSLHLLSVVRCELTITTFTFTSVFNTTSTPAELT